MSLDQDLQAMAAEAGVDHFGIADLLLAHEAIRKQGGEQIAAYPRAISLGINLIHPLVDLLPTQDSHTSGLYRHHGYDIINTRLDLLISQLAGRIQQEGYAAFPVPASKRTNDEKISAFFSHKLAAHCAGLGWIGKSCLLITPKAGPRVRWGSILTNAPLHPTGTPMSEQCGSCRICVESCPVSAFTGEPFREQDQRESRFDATKCDNYFNALKRQGKDAVCGMCLYSCPYGLRASQTIKNNYG